MLSNAYFLAKFRFDTAENEPAKNLQKFAKFANFADPNPRSPHPAPRGAAGQRLQALDEPLLLDPARLLLVEGPVEVQRTHFREDLHTQERRPGKFCQILEGSFSAISEPICASK